MAVLLGVQRKPSCKVFLVVLLVPMHTVSFLQGCARGDEKRVVWVDHGALERHVHVNGPCTSRRCSHRLRMFEIAQKQTVCPIRARSLECILLYATLICAHGGSLWPAYKCYKAVTGFDSRNSRRHARFHDTPIHVHAQTSRFGPRPALRY